MKTEDNSFNPEEIWRPGSRSEATGFQIFNHYPSTRRAVWKNPGRLRNHLALTEIRQILYTHAGFEAYQDASQQKKLKSDSFYALQ